MPTQQTITAYIAETGESKYAVKISVSGHIFTGDEPIDKDGSNLGPSPYDLLTAALGECTCMTLRWYAIQQKWPLEKVEVQINHHKENKLDIFTKQITLHGDALTEDQHKKLIEIAAKCPVQRTLEGSPGIHTIIK